MQDELRQRESLWRLCRASHRCSSHLNGEGVAPLFVARRPAIGPATSDAAVLNDLSRWAALVPFYLLKLRMTDRAGRQEQHDHMRPHHRAQLHHGIAVRGVPKPHPFFQLLRLSKHIVDGTKGLGGQ